MGSVYSVLAENTRILKAFVRFDDKVKIYPFIIDKIVDSRDDNFSVYKQVSANGLAFAELGKVGYKLELTQDTLELEVEKDNTIVPTINYWLDKVFPSEKDANGNVKRWLTPWCYEVRTEYYESDRIAGKVYDEEYVNNWNVGSDGTLTAASYEPTREKARIISCKDSNKYNITQTIAETFELFCRYEYSCDERGSFVKTYTDDAGKVWTGRKVIFYNRAIKKDNPLIIEYKKNLNSISRESDSSEIYTKLYVSPIASEVMTDGYVSIANSAANPTMDEFILNFDYLHETRSISDYQYRQVEIYKANIRKINEVLADLSPQINDLEVEINNLKAEAAGYESQISSAEEQLATYQKLRDNALTNGVVQKGASNACSVIFSDVGAYRKATLNFEGIVASSINGYAKSDYATKLFSASDLNIVSSEGVPSGNNIDLILDDTGFPCALATKRVFDSNIVYLELQYSPANKYKKVCENLWLEKQGAEAKLTSTNSKVAKFEEKLKALESSYNAKIKEKENINLAFENLMGPALREGYWTPEDYQDPRENFTEDITYSTSSSRVPITGEPVRNCFIFDAIPFENEQLAWTPDNSAADKKKYYKYFSLEGLGSELTREFQIHLTRHFIFTAKSGGETFVKGNYCILYDNIKYYFTLTTTYTVSKIEIYQHNGDKSQLYINITTTSGATFSRPNNQTPLANAIDITSKFEGIGTYVGDYVLYENAGFVVAYMNMNGTVKPVALLNDDDIPYDSYTGAYLKMDNPEKVIIFNSYATENTNKYELCYPRIFLSKDNTLYDADTLTITKGSTFEKFTDYSVLLRGGKPYITLKNFTPYVYSANATYRVSYQVSRANEMLYLDAMQVAKDNSRPRYSYEVELANLPNQLNAIELGQLAYINDHLLGVHAASGYVDEIEYDLSMPKNDRISIKNYKTKFEDLFSTISAQSEAMKVNKISYDTAANSFTPGGGLLGSVLQSAIAKENPYFDYSTCGVEITKDRGIILTNDKPYANGVFGQVALRGSGIFVSDSIDPITGRRVWSNAITAGGINASLITTGQLDTNLIRIFSGDQMTFQWNSEGLIAYKQDGITGVDINTFIRYSDKGLQYYKANVTDPIVSLDWNGLTLRNNNGDKTVYLDAQTGNVIISGTIYATSGEIGGLKIQNTTLSDLNKTANDAESAAAAAQGTANDAKSDAKNAKDAADEAQKTANDGKTKAESIIGGTVSVPWVKSTGIEISGKNLTVGAEGKLILQSNAGIEVQSGGNITIKSGGKFTVASNNFAIDENGNVAMTGKVIATSGNIGGLEIKNTTLSDLNKTANDANSTANDAKSKAETANTNITNITNGTTAIPHVKSTAIEINGKNMTIGAEGKLTLQSNAGIVVQSGGSININSGGKFTIDSTNFKIDSSGNVTLTGKITATDGKIGGWNISTDRLYAGSGSNYVALNTNASYPAIWAGAGVYSDAPFRVYQDGSVYITSLYVLDEAGTTPSKIDLRSNYWKMDSAYAHSVKTLSVADGTLTIALYNGTTVNFNKADLSGLKVSGWSWPLNTATDYSSATVKVLLEAGEQIKSFETSLNTTSFVNYGKTLMSVKMDPEPGSGAITLSPGGKQDVFASLMDGETEKSRIGVRVTAATISKVGQTGASTLNTSTSLSCTIRVTASNGWYHDFSGVIIGAVPAYDEGYKKGKAAISLVMDPIDGSSVSLGFGASKTITAKLVDGSTTLKTASVTVKAPAKPTIVLGITPGTKTLDYGEVQTVTATVEENGTEIKRGTATITAPPAVSVSSVTVKDTSQLVSTLEVQFSVEVKLSNNKTATYSKLKVGASDIFKAGKSATALAISPGTNTTLGYGESKTVTAQIKDGNTELKKTSVVITAPAAVTLDSVEKTALSYDTGNSTYNMTVVATASNGETKTVGIPFVATEAFNDGYNNGISSAKSKVYATISPSSTVSLNYDETKTIFAYARYEGGSILSYASTTVSGPAAVTLDSLTFGSPEWVDNTHTSISATATASNGKTITDSVPIDVTAHYNAGVNYANSLYSTVNVTPISTAHRVSYVSFTRQGTGKSPTPKVLYNKAGQAVTVYDVGSAATVYTKGSKVEYYTVAYTGTVLYEAGTQKTYYTKS